MSKPKFAMYWGASCGGCEISVLNTHEKLLDIDATFEVVFWPVAMDAKIKDVVAMPDQSIFVTLLNGGIRNEENEEMAHLMRRKSKVLVAFGSCACEGCIPGLANFSPIETIVSTAYHTLTTDNPDNALPSTETTMPEGKIYLPKLKPVLRTVDQVVDVDYYVPGCPPESEQVSKVIDLLVGVAKGEFQLPEKGCYLGTLNSTVCDECPRERNVKRISKFERIQFVDHFDPGLCLLEQGIPCNGPATRAGCGAKCPKASAQCIGCYGPAEGVIDNGSRLISAFASIVESKDPSEVDHILDGIPDPAGQFYRFTLAKSLLQAGRSAWQGKE
jgi:F420-non-reducing hydrogenase small subunit